MMLDGRRARTHRISPPPDRLRHTSPALALLTLAVVSLTAAALTVTVLIAAGRAIIGLLG